MKLGHDSCVDESAPPSQRCLVGVYYSLTPDSMKKRICNSFNGNGGNTPAVIASTSLSMGVDFPHVKYVVHFGPDRTITDHLQQAGRAGRDSQQAFNNIIYQGKHLSQCEQSIRDVIKKNNCVRQLVSIPLYGW